MAAGIKMVIGHFPKISNRDIILSKLDKNLKEENLNKIDFFNQDFNKMKGPMAGLG